MTELVSLGGIGTDTGCIPIRTHTRAATKLLRYAATQQTRVEEVLVRADQVRSLGVLAALLAMKSLSYYAILQL